MPSILQLCSCWLVSPKLLLTSFSGHRLLACFSDLVWGIKWYVYLVPGGVEGCVSTQHTEQDEAYAPPVYCIRVHSAIVPKHLNQETVSQRHQLVITLLFPKHGCICSCRIPLAPCNLRCHSSCEPALLRAPEIRTGTPGEMSMLSCKASHHADKANLLSWHARRCI